MINKKEFFRKVKKNRFLVLAISVIVITGVYYGVEKAIDSYSFNTNSDIVENADDSNEEEWESEEDVSENKKWFERLFGNDEEKAEDEMAGVDDMLEDDEAREGEKNSNDDANDFGKVPENEVDLELEEVVEGTEDSTSLNGEDVQAESAPEEKIYVYITGEVNVPGVVILNKGSRIVDAINAAGGTTVKANVSKVNLVYVLEDGMKVNIPNNNDLKNNPDFEYITMSSGDGADDAGASTSTDYSGDYENSNASSESNYSVVNINTATQTELESLPGIGPSLALNIINYRKENGKFSSIEELKNVSGIGEIKFNRLKRYITV